jgi:glycolate oxidase iron-sulfur subunit
LAPSVLSQWGQAVFHPPCTLQHGQKIKGKVEGILTQLGFALSSPPEEAHLCCGSAGTYSVLQAHLSQELKTRKLLHLNNTQSSAILSANVGCISHLQSESTVPVMHWIEWLDQGLQKSASALTHA